MENKVTVISGGSGGNAGTIVWRRIAVADLGATENYTVVAGGSGGSKRNNTYKQ